MAERRGARNPFRRVVAVSLVAGLVLGGCSPTYVMRAAYEEAKLLWRREPIDRLLRRGSIPDGQRDKLELVLRVREHARDALGLEVDGSYSSVSKVDGGAVVHVLSAARRDRLVRYTWWFPIVGRVPYKGFFSKDAAERAAKRLEQDGYDTYVRASIAFSTLGWFDDPLPSTLLDRGPVGLADVVFHELFHNTLFLPGEAIFNESAANFVGHRAAIDFFCARPGTWEDECREANVGWADTLRVSRFLSEVISELEAFYDTRPKGAELEAGRDRLFREIRERFRELELAGTRYAKLAEAPLNNATLLHDRVYFRDLELFEELYQIEGGVRGAIVALRKIADHGDSPFKSLRTFLRPPSLDLAGFGRLAATG